MAISSPWAMLMTPISPNTIDNPSAMSTRTVNRLRPLKACIAMVSKVMGDIGSLPDGAPQISFGKGFGSISFDS